MKSLPIVLAALIALGVVPSACAQQRIVVETGHIGAVNALAYDKQDSLVFSGGSDGTVRAWNTTTHELVGVLQVGHLPIQMVAVDPSRHEIATFETDNLNTYRITAWNWQSGKELFSRNLNEAPLFMQFSPKGNYLVYGVTAWRSLYFLNSSTGSTLPYFSSGIGIVSAVIISQSGNSIMTYSPSGQIQYWSVQSGNLKQTYQTLPNLSAISFTPNSRYMIAAHNNNLVMVDLIGGKTVSTTSLPGIQATSLDPSTNEVAVYADGSNGPQFSLYSISGGLIPMASAFQSPPGPISDIVFANDNLFASQQNAGTLLSQSPYFSEHTFGVNHLLPINDIAVNNNRLVLTSKNHVLSFATNFFGVSNLSNAKSVSFSTMSNPYKGPTGVLSLTGGRFVMWNQSGNSGSYRIYNPNTGIGSSIGNFPAPFIEVQNANGQLLTLDSQGNINLLNIDSGKSTFNYTAFGLQTVTYVSPTKIVAGMSQNGVLNTALLQLNPTTGETVPIPDPALLVFGLAYDPTNQILYSLDIDGSGSNMSTVLKSHPLATLGNGTSLYSYSGEDQNAGIAVAAASDSIYTSLGFSGVRHIVASSGKTTKLESTNHIPRKLIINGKWLISLNTDSTVSIWNRSTGKRIATLYVFKDLSWAAVLASGQYLASPGADTYLKLFNGVKPSEKSLSSRRYSFPNAPPTQFSYPPLW